MSTSRVQPGEQPEIQSLSRHTALSVLQLASMSLGRCVCVSIDNSIWLHDNMTEDPNSSLIVHSLALITVDTTLKVCYPFYIDGSTGILFSDLDWQIMSPELP